MTRPFPDLVSFNCLHCQAFAQHEWHWLSADRCNGAPLSPANGVATAPEDWRTHIIKKDLDDRKGRKSPQISGHSGGGWIIDNAYLARCTACQNSSWWWGTMLLWPRLSGAPQPNCEMPDGVLKLYQEAALIVGQSPRGATALLRLSVEQLCQFLGKTGNIDKMIGDLVRDGLQVTVQQALDAVRVIGNNAVHPGKIDFDDSPEVAMTLFHLLNLIVTRMIAEPKEVAEIFQMLPEGARAAISRRDQSPDSEKGPA